MKHPGLKEEYLIHGKHTWGDCRLNPRSESYDPPRPYFKNNVQRQNDNYQSQNFQNRNQNFQNRNSNQRQSQLQNSGRQGQRHHYLNQGNNNGEQQSPLGRGVERQFFGTLALCLIPLAKKKRNIFLYQLSLVLLAILKSLAPLGAGVIVIAPLPERLPGLIEGPLRPHSSFEYMCLVINLL